MQDLGEEADPCGEGHLFEALPDDPVLQRPRLDLLRQRQTGPAAAALSLGGVQGEDDVLCNGSARRPHRLVLRRVARGAPEHALETVARLRLQAAGEPPAPAGRQVLQRQRRLHGPRPGLRRLALLRRRCLFGVEASRCPHAEAREGPLRLIGEGRGVGAADAAAERSGDASGGHEDGGETATHGVRRRKLQVLKSFAPPARSSARAPDCKTT
mmetsp:Transcript_39048/g.112786  ORF Transcript_39048/g.112786 Transcript_39048/m.112786 type:complete len:213 (+) Transcript_39048:652-1290(+)